MDEKELHLFDGKAVARKLFDSWAYILLALVLLMSVLSGFVETGISLAATVNVGMSYVVLLLFCYAARYSFDGIAKARAAETEAHKSALDKHAALRARVKDYDSKSFSAFCDCFRAEELASTRKMIMEEAMLSEDDLADFISSGKLPEGATLTQRRALLRAQKTKPIRLTRFMIGAPLKERSKRKSFVTPEQELMLKSLPSYLSTAITVFFPVSLALSVIASPSLAELFEALLKALTVLLAGVKGYSLRYRNMTETVPAYVEQQEDFCDAYEKWLKKESKE